MMAELLPLSIYLWGDVEDILLWLKMINLTPEKMVPLFNCHWAFV